MKNKITIGVCFDPYLANIANKEASECKQSTCLDLIRDRLIDTTVIRFFSSAAGLDGYMQALDDSHSNWVRLNKKVIKYLDKIKPIHKWKL